MLALNATNTGYAKNMVMPHKQLTLVQKIKWQKRIIKHDKWVIRTKIVHNSSLVRFAKAQLKWTTLELRQSLQYYSYSRSLYGSQLFTGSFFPPHHKLWLCISKYEGGVHSVNPNGHYGMLQMHAGWGYGTSYHASDDSQVVQEWAAERAYKASGFSFNFLKGQWFNYDAAMGECYQYI